MSSRLECEIPGRSASCCTPARGTLARSRSRSRRSATRGTKARCHRNHCSRPPHMATPPPGNGGPGLCVEVQGEVTHGGVPTVSSNATTATALMVNTAAGLGAPTKASCKRKEMGRLCELGAHPIIRLAWYWTSGRFSFFHVFFLSRQPQDYEQPYCSPTCACTSLHSQMSPNVVQFLRSPPVAGTSICFRASVSFSVNGVDRGHDQIDGFPRLGPLHPGAATAKESAVPGRAGAPAQP